MLFSLALTVATLYLVFRGIDRQTLVRLLAMQDRALLAGAVFFILLQVGLGAERWRTILSMMTRGRPPSARSVQAVFYASMFFGSLPVGIIGSDVARVLLARKFPLSVKQLALSVILDRLLVIAALMALAVVTSSSITRPLAIAAWSAGAILAVTCGIGLLLLQPVERMLGRWRDQRLIHFVLRTLEELRYLTHGAGLLALLLAAASSVCGALGAYCIARSLNIDVGPVAMIAVVSIVAIITALPISLAGWGVREVSIVALLGLIGIDRGAALLLSVEFGIICTLTTLPGALVWLALREHAEVSVPARQTGTATPDRP